MCEHLTLTAGNSFHPFEPQTAPTGRWHCVRKQPFSCGFKFPVIADNNAAGELN